MRQKPFYTQKKNSKKNIQIIQIYFVSFDLIFWVKKELCLFFFYFRLVIFHCTLQVNFNMETNDVCMICLDEPAEESSKRYTVCCGKLACYGCASLLLRHLHSGCPNCRSILDRVWVMLDVLSFKTVTLNCNGQRSTFVIPDRARRRFFRTPSSYELTGANDADMAALVENLKADAVQCLVPFLNSLLPRVPNSNIRFQFCIRRPSAW